MKNFSLKLFTAILLVCVSTTFCFAVRTYQPNGTSSFTGANTYCQGATANALTFTYTTCSAGGGGAVGGGCSISWYTNTTNSTALGTATRVSGPTAFTTATAATGAQSYTPSTAAAVSLYYFCVITTNAAGCAGAAGTTITSSTTQLVAVNATPAAVTVTGGGTFCGSATLDASNGGSGNIYYQGTTSGGTSTADLSTSQIITTSGTYYFNAQASSGCWGTQGSATVVINPTPTIYNVTGGGNYCSGGTGSDVQLSGSDATTTYQLYNGSTTVGGPVTGGATPLDFGPETAAGIYTVLATEGTCTANMNGSATVVIDPLPAVYDVTGSGSYCSGGPGLYVDLNYSDIGVEYQLYNGSTPVGSPLDGAETSLSFGPETAAGTYTVLATNLTTLCTNNMNGSATITVLPAPTQFMMTGAAGYCAGGMGVDIQLNGSVSGTTYQLYDGATAVGIAMGGTGGTLDFGNQLVAGTYSVLATITATGCTGGMANTITFVVYPLPTVYTVGGGGSYCQGGSGVEITLSNSDIGVNYQLYYGSTTVGSLVAGTNVPPLDMGLETAAGSYTVFATNATTGCTNNMSGSATVSINPLPAIFAMTGGGGYCAGDLGVHVGLSGSELGVNYELYDDATLVSTLPGTGSSLDFGLQTTPGNYTVVADNATTLCTSTMSGVATVSINPLPNVYTLSAGGSYCAGGTGIDLTLSGSDAGVSYQLYNGSTPAGSPVAGTGVGTLDLGFQTAAGTYTVLATNTTTLCQSNMSGTATIIINPLPTVFTVTGGGDYCSGGIGVNVGLSGSTSGVSYQLYNGATLTGTLAGTGLALNFGLQTAAGTYTVLATNTTTFCTNDMAGSATVVIDPLPNVYNVTGGGAYCSGGAGSDIGLSWSDVGVNYELYDGATLITTMAGVGGTLDFGLQTAAGTYAVIASNATTGCIIAMNGNATVTINSLPTVYNVTGGGSYCSGGTGVDVGLSWSDVGVSYQLYASGAPAGSSLSGIGAALNFGFFTAAGTYLVVATNNTTGCLSLMADSAVITINPLPAAISGVTSICVGSTTTLTDATSGGTWSSNDAAIATIDPSLGLMTGVASGITTITYTLPTTCIATAGVTINALPVVAAISGITNECVGSGNTLIDATGGGIWSSTNTSIATIDPVAGTVAGVATGIVTISYTVTNSFGCIAAVTTPDTVNALPVAAAITGPMSVCVNSTITLSDDSTGGAWSSNNTAVATIDASLGTVNGISAGNTTITYTITSAAGCMSFVTANETIDPLPSVSGIMGATSVCAGLTISLSDTTSGGVWSSSNTSVATINITGTVSGIDPGTVMISYTATNTYGCSNAAMYNITVGNAMPASAINPAGSITLCNGTPINLVLTTTGSGLTYQWAMDGNDIAGATNGSYITDTTGLFTITLNNGTCSETLSGTTVLAPPNPSISYNSAGHYLYTGGSFASYQWYKNGVPITGANTSILAEPGAGVYKVVVSDVNGCYVSSANYDITGGGGGGGGGGTSGVNNTTLVTDVKIYPNPASSIVQIEAPVTVNVSVISTDGKLVIQQKQATSIDVSQLADGLYIIMIYDENNTLLQTDKFAKIK